MMPLSYHSSNLLLIALETIRLLLQTILAQCSISTPLKIWFSDVFKGYNETLGYNELISSCVISKTILNC